MDFNALSIVKFGDVDSLGEFLFENAQQHKYFQQVFMDQGVSVPVYPLADANPDNLDDWLLAHQVEHQAFAGLLGLNNPFNMLDVDFNNESEFYDWLASHLYIHEQIYNALDSYGVTAGGAAVAPAAGTGYTPIIVVGIQWINNSSTVIPWQNNASVTIDWVKS